MFCQVIPEYFVPLKYPGIKENLYEISNYGRIISLTTGKFMNGIYNQGYCDVTLQTLNGVSTTISIHTLVAYTFIPKTKEDIRLGRDCVNHKNLCRSANYVDNLEWTTIEENNQHFHKARQIIKMIGEKIDSSRESNWGGNFDSSGENNFMSRLSNNQVHTICQALQDGKSYVDSAIYAELEPSKQNICIISRIAQGVIWTDISRQYSIPEPPRRNQYIDYKKYVIPICDLLKAGMSNGQIVNELDIPNGNIFIKRLLRGENHSKITSLYGYIDYDNIYSPYYESIRHLLETTELSAMEIVQNLNLPGSLENSIKVIGIVKGYLNAT